MSFVNQVANLEAETIIQIDEFVAEINKRGEALNPRLIAIAKTQLEIGFAMLSKAAKIVDINNG